MTEIKALPAPNQALQPSWYGYDAEPQPNGTEKQLKSLTGRYWNKGKYVEFQGEQVEGGTEGKLVDYLQNHEALPGGTDADLVHHLRNSVSNDGSKDGFGPCLVPADVRGAE